MTIEVHPTNTEEGYWLVENYTEDQRFTAKQITVAEVQCNPEDGNFLTDPYVLTFFSHLLPSGFALYIRQ